MIKGSGAGFNGSTNGCAARGATAVIQPFATGLSGADAAVGADTSPGGPDRVEAGGMAASCFGAAGVAAVPDVHG